MTHARKRAAGRGLAAVPQARMPGRKLPAQAQACPRRRRPARGPLAARLLNQLAVGGALVLAVPRAGVEAQHVVAGQREGLGVCGHARLQLRGGADVGDALAQLRQLRRGGAGGRRVLRLRGELGIEARLRGGGAEVRQGKLQAV